MGNDKIREHNCNEDTVWQNTKDYNLIKCYVCDLIIKFRFKSTWKQIKFLFWDRIK